MKIIIIGCGKAGLLHRNIYQLIFGKANADGEIFYVDRLKNPLWGAYNCDKSDISEKVYESIEEVISENNLYAEDIIADICVPAGGMLSTIDACKRNGIRNCICEKPFVMYKEPQYDINSLLEGMNIIIVKNYLYSKASIKVKEFIEHEHLTIKSIASNFSKDRRDESYQMRAFETKEDRLSIWEVEVPHLIYLNNFFGEIPQEILEVKSNDMVFVDKRLKNLGNGKLVYKTKNNIMCSVYSDLESEETIRKIDINCDRGYSFHIVYPPIPNAEEELLSSLEIKQNGKALETIYFHDDNNIYNMLQDYLKIIKDKKTNRVTSISNLIHDSEFMEELVKPEF